MFATLIYLRHIKIAKLKCRKNFITNLYNHCLRLLLGRLKYPGKIGNNAWLRKILGENKVHYGPCENGNWPYFESTGFCYSALLRNDPL